MTGNSKEQNEEKKWEKGLSQSEESKGISILFKKAG